jgi:hypothetical protein
VVGGVWVCTGFLPHSTTPVAFISTRDQSAGDVTCSLLDPQDLGRGVRWGIRLGELLEELLAGL